MKKHLCWIISIITVKLVTVLASCQRAVPKNSPPFDEWVQTPIPIETLVAYDENSPITNQMQAVIAARARLLVSRMQPVGDPSVLCAEFIRYEDAVIRMQAKESDRYPADEKVWLICFQGNFGFSPPGGPSEVSFVDVFVLLQPDGGILVTWRKPEAPYPYPSQYSDFVTPMGYPYPANPPLATPSPVSDKRAPDNRLGFKQAALTNEDIPYSSDPLYSFFIDPQIVPTDNSRDLTDLCNIACVKKIWTDTGRRRAFVIVMYQVGDADQAKRKVEKTLTHDIETFGSNLITGTINIPGLPAHSWVTASTRIEGTVGDLITFQTSWGPVVVILTEQGEFQPRDLPLDDYFHTIQKLALLQLDKLKSAGYTEK